MLRGFAGLYALLLVGCADAANVERPEAPTDYFEYCRQTDEGSPDCPEGKLECIDLGAYWNTRCTYSCEADSECPEPVSDLSSACVDGYCYLEEQ